MATLTSDSPDTGQGPRSASTEDRLRRSAIKLFAAKGYASTSIREIIEEAGVTRPVLYYYFKNKEDLYTRLIESEFERSVSIIRETVESSLDFRSKLVQIVKRVFQHAESAPGLVQMMLNFFFSPEDNGLSIDREELSRERFELLAQVMADGIVEGRITGGTPEALALVFSGIMDMHVISSAQRTELSLSPEMADSLVDLFLRGAQASGADSRVPLEPGFYGALANRATPPERPKTGGSQHDA